MISLRSLLLEIASQSATPGALELGAGAIATPGPDGGPRIVEALGIDLPGRWIRIERLCKEYAVTPSQAAAAYREVISRHPGLPIAEARCPEGEVIYGLLPVAILSSPGRRLLAAFLGDTWATDAVISALFGVDVTTWRSRAARLSREGAIRVEGDGPKRRIWRGDGVARADV